MKSNSHKISILVLGGVIFLVLLGSMIKNKYMDKNTDIMGKINVVTSFYPLTFLAEEIGGQQIKVTTLTPAGVEPHDWEPAASDLVTMEKSQVIFLNGGGLEAWSEKIKNNFDGTTTNVVTVGEGIIDPTTVDPHIWLSPSLAIKEAETIYQTLIKIDAINQAYYQTNFEALKNKLADLDKAYQQGLVTCQSKTIVTSHLAFGYLAKSYGLMQVGIAGLSPEEEPSVQKMAQLSQEIKEKHIKYLFFETMASPELAETLAAETGAKTLVLNPIEGLTNDDIKNGANYLTIMQSNLENLRTALECQ